MKKSPFVLALLIAVGLGGVIFVKEQEIGDLERLARASRIGSQELAGQVERGRVERAELQKQLQAANAELEQVRKQLSETKATPAPAAAEKPSDASQ